MAARIKYIAQKRATLKGQLTAIETLFAAEPINEALIKSRMIRLKEQYLAYEEFNDELTILNNQLDDLNEFEGIQIRYFELAAKVAAFETPAALSTTVLNATSAVVEKTRQLKLPVAELPKFDGDIGSWLSFKNTFSTMIDSREDITDLQKFVYLKNSLLEEALQKVSVYNVSADNYKNAWTLLVESYDRKRILIANHLDAILDLPELSQPTSKGLTKLVDTVKQHMNMLKSLQVVPDEHLIIRIIERVLPAKTRIRWEEKLDFQNFPKLEDLYKFISESAFRLLAAEQNDAQSKADNNNKRPLRESNQRSSKARRGENGARTFLTTAAPNCSLCKDEKHPLFKCLAFKRLELQARWDFVKRARLCRNCLRSHLNEKCNSSFCKVCSKPHHTLLHNSAIKSNGSLQNSTTQTGKTPITSVGSENRSISS